MNKNESLVVDGVKKVFQARIDELDELRTNAKREGLDISLLSTRIDELLMMKDWVIKTINEGEELHDGG